MVVLYALLVLMILFLVYMRLEAAMVKVEHIRFPGGSGNLKVLQLSDIHTGLLRVSAEKVKKAILQEKPDVILLTGDYVTKQKEIPAFFRFIDGIKSTCPIYAILGNHDYKAFWNDEAGLGRFISELEQKGVQFLQNTTHVFEKKGKRYNLIGVNDLRYGAHNVEKALDTKDTNVSANIAFSHNPDIVFDFPRSGVDYLFCGHFHGGQIWAPFNIEFTLMRREKLCKMGIRRGHHLINGIHLYISRGIGNVFVPLRFFSRPEITIFHIP